MIILSPSVLPETAPAAPAPVPGTAAPTAAFDLLMAAELPAPLAAEAVETTPATGEPANSDQAAALAAALLWTPAPLVSLPPSAPTAEEGLIPADVSVATAPASEDYAQAVVPTFRAPPPPTGAFLPQSTATAPLSRAVPSIFSLPVINSPMEATVPLAPTPTETDGFATTTTAEASPSSGEASMPPSASADWQPELPTTAAEPVDIPVAPVDPDFATVRVAYGSQATPKPLPVRLAATQEPALPEVSAPTVSDTRSPLEFVMETPATTPTPTPAVTSTATSTAIPAVIPADEQVVVAMESSPAPVADRPVSGSPVVAKRARTFRADPRLPHPENSAELTPTDRGSGQDRSELLPKTFVSITAKGARVEKDIVGTGVAKTAADMSFVPTDRSTSTPTPAAATLPAPEVVHFDLPATTDVQPVARDTVAKVLSVIDAQEKPVASSRRSVALDFDFGGERLAVRVEFHGGAVRAHFQASSPELRSAIASEWSQALANRGSSLHGVEPEFVSTAAQGSASYSATDDGAARQQSRQAPPEPLPTPVRRFVDRPVTLTQAAPENLPRYHQSYTTRHLHTFA